MFVACGVCTCVGCCVVLFCMLRAVLDVVGLLLGSLCGLVSCYC